MPRCVVAFFLIVGLIAPSLQTPYVTFPFLGIDELPLRVGGTKPHDYDFAVRKPWVRGKPNASRGPSDYVALLNRVDAVLASGSGISVLIKRSFTH